MADRAEEVFFFAGPAGHRLFGFLHRPIGPAKAGLVYAHPFAEEMNQSHAVMRRAASRLAASGHPVLRFHFSGCGDSEGLLRDATADAWIAEIGAACGELARRTGAGKVGVMGLRAGANLAAEYARSAPGVACGILLQPAANLKVCMQQFLRQRLATGMVSGGAGFASTAEMVKAMEGGAEVEVMGYPIAAGLYGSMASRSGSPAGEYACPMSLFSVSDADEPSDPFRRMAEGTSAAGRPGFLRHFRATPFWDRYWEWDAPYLAGPISDWIAGAA